ncbi:MAG: T9SS type A sorting domain-containing protein [Chitinophagales bacterium]|nr:T9SS type A sorting domain-containing protein [Chitinophagales bacterium]
MKYSFYKTVAAMAFFAYALLPVIAHAQIYIYTNSINGLPSVVDVNATGSSLTRVNGAIVPASPCASGFSATKFSNATVFNTGLKAVEFTVMPNTGYQLNIQTFWVGLRRSSTGPALTRFAYSVDGGATWTDEGIDHAPKNASCGNVLNYSWNMGFTTTGAVNVRIYGFSASATTGTLQVLNITLDGTVTAISAPDNDGDGFTSSTDCNDNDPSIYPGAAETCNGTDDNCDGLVDEGIQQLFYADTDQDGFGDAGISTLACDAPSGYVANGSDCSDANAAIYPGAPDLCNLIDDDCDGQIDENMLTATISPAGTVTECKDVKVTLTANTGPGITYTWYRNNVILAGETQSTYKTKKAGSFKVTETNNFDCSSTSAITKIKRITCLEKQLEDNITPATFNIYPNPNRGSFNVYLHLSENESASAIVEVINALGQKICSQRVMVNDGVLQHEITMNLADGIYIVRTEVGGRVYSSKIVCRQE